MLVTAAQGSDQVFEVCEVIGLNCVVSFSFIITEDTIWL